MGLGQAVSWVIAYDFNNPTKQSWNDVNMSHGDKARLVGAPLSIKKMRFEQLNIVIHPFRLTTWAGIRIILRLKSVLGVKGLS